MGFTAPPANTLQLTNRLYNDKCMKQNKTRTGANILKRLYPNHLSLWKDMNSGWYQPTDTQQDPVDHRLHHACHTPRYTPTCFETLIWATVSGILVYVWNLCILTGASIECLVGQSASIKKSWSMIELLSNHFYKHLQHLYCYLEIEIIVNGFKWIVCFG